MHIGILLAVPKVLFARQPDYGRVIPPPEGKCRRPRHLLD
jgi:hypothetical protein